MGLVMVWARVAALAPRLANFLSHAPGLASLAKLVAGIAPARDVPRFAPYTDRRGLHLAEVLKLARTAPAPGPYPERHVRNRLPPLPLRARVGRGLVKAALAGSAIAIAWHLLGRAQR